LPEEKIDVRKELQELLQTFNDYTERLKLGSSDTDIAIKNWNLEVGKHNKNYIVEVKVDLDLTSKTKQNTKQ
jgi:hypothetical protein